MSEIEERRHPEQRRVLAVLAGAQVLVGIGVGAAVAVSGLLAEDVTGSEVWAGLAQTCTVVGAALAALPLATLTTQRGRRTGLGSGLFVGAIGAVVVVLGASAHSLSLLLLGTVLAGVANASALQARYAATDLSVARHRARDLSLVVWASTVGAVAGPNLAGPSGDLGEALGVPRLAGGYVVAAAAYALGLALIVAALRPDPLLQARAEGLVDPPVRQSTSETLRQSLAAVRTHGNAALGLAGMAAAHTTMVAIMVMTPVHMKHVDVTLTVIGVVISVHIAGMYALAPLFGLASDRWGRRPVLAASVVQLWLAALIAGSAPGDDSLRLGVGLFLLGTGWSCALVAGSALLTESVEPSDRTAVQGLSDLVMNSCGAIGGVLAGVVMALGGYGWLAVLAAVVVATYAAFLARSWSTPVPA